MGYEYFTIPYLTALTKEEGWDRDPNSEHTYSIVRAHYAVREHQLNDPSKGGEVVGVSTSLRGASQKITESKEYEYTEVRMRQSVQESLLEEETITEITSSIAASLGAGVAKLSGELKSSIKAQLKQSFKNTFTVQITESAKERKVKTLEYVVDSDQFGANTRLVTAKAYKRHALDLYLVFVDYLLVEYRRPPLGVRLKRNKLPAITGKVHPNIIKLDWPLVSMLFWRQVPDSLLLVPEKDYRIEVDDPFEIMIQELTVTKRFPVRLPPKPSLYELSEMFPRKRWA